MNEAGLSLKDKNGGIKDFETFKKEAGDVFKKSGLNLRAEYQHATQATQMAAKWNDIEEDGDRYDLQYRTVGDDKVRHEHAELNGTTLPPSDPFWGEYYPPNGWGCRCTAVQVRKGKYQHTDSADALERGKAATPSDKDKIFRFNAGKGKQVFPDKHPTIPKGCGSCKNLKLVFDSERAICKACQSIDAAKVKVSREFARNHYKSKFKDGEQTWEIGNGKIDKLNCSYQDIRNITGKPHTYPYARNMAVYYLEKIAKQAKYIGSSGDAKKEAKGHAEITKWHYLEFDFLGKKSVLEVKELANGKKYPHHIQDEEHFSYTKIKNKAK
jgi:SPP1 gp7 family putative phage head morphogenesis protein